MGLKLLPLTRQQIRAIKAKSFERGLAKIKPVKGITKQDIMGIKTDGQTLAQKLNKRIMIKSEPTLKFPVTVTDDKFFAQLLADRKIQLEHPDGRIKSVAPKAKFEVVRKSPKKFEVRSSADVKKIAKGKGISAQRFHKSV